MSDCRYSCRVCPALANLLQEAKMYIFLSWWFSYCRGSKERKCRHAPHDDTWGYKVAVGRFFTKTRNFPLLLTTFSHGTVPLTTNRFQLGTWFSNYLQTFLKVGRVRIAWKTNHRDVQPNEWFTPWRFIDSKCSFIKKMTKERVSRVI